MGLSRLLKIGGTLLGAIGVTAGYKAVKTELAAPKFSNNKFEYKSQDTFQGSNSSRERMYSLIGELCAAYDIDIEEAKKAGLLEQIAGCSEEELAKKSDEEIKSYIDSLKHALTWKSWKLPWQKRDINDITSIAKNANKNYIAKEVGITLGSSIKRSFKHFFGIDTGVNARIKSKGSELTEKDVEDYFQQILTENIKSNDPESIQNAYTKAMQTYGELLIDSESIKEKELLTAAISKLQASSRGKAAQLSLASCRNNKNLYQAVGRGLSANFEKISSTKDLLGEFTSKEDNTLISHLSFSHMNEEDSFIALTRMKNRRQELAQKIANGEELTEEESRYYDEAQISQYSGAMTGSSCNADITEEAKLNIISNVNNDTKEFGIQEKVYSQTADFIEKHAGSLPITTNEFISKADKATGGEYSRVILNGSSSSPKTTQATNQPVNGNKQATSNKTVTQKPQTAQNTTTSPVNNTQNKKADTHTTAHSIEKPAKLANTDNHKEVKTKNNAAVTSPANKAQPKTAIIQIYKKSGIEGVKEFQKAAKMSEIELTQEILNSNNTGKELQQWAMAKFKTLPDSMKKIAFIGIHKIDNKIEASKYMRKEDIDTSKMDYNTSMTIERVLEKKEQAQKV